MPVATKEKSISEHFEPRVLAMLRGLDLQARYVVEGFLSGLHRSPFHGMSVEFSDYRDYMPGDDIRQIDWRVYARSDRLCVKRFIAETNTRFYILCDNSASMAYRGADAWASKFECARLLGAALSLLMLRQNDAAGLLTLDEGGVEAVMLKPSQKMFHFGQIVRVLESMKPSGGTRIPALLHQAAQLAHRRSVMVILSDLLEPSDSFEDALKQLRFQGHDCMIFQVLDRDEVEFPFDESSIFEDLETGARRRVSPSGVRKKYLERFSTFMDAHRELFRQLEMPHCLFRTDGDPWEILVKFLGERKQLS